MRVAIALSATGGPWGDFVTYAQEAERLGVAICFVAEAWGSWRMCSRGAAQKAVAKGRLKFLYIPELRLAWE
jgi:alkanesulfonate monooxygenase SsuD/methylene tetrahydromethanopterin reductase-like flavin-dependent oxidoreductase (luciferase family)